MNSTDPILPKQIKHLTKLDLSPSSIRKRTKFVKSNSPTSATNLRIRQHKNLDISEILRSTNDFNRNLVKIHSPVLPSERISFPTSPNRSSMEQIRSPRVKNFVFRDISKPRLTKAVEKSSNARYLAQHTIDVSESLPQAMQTLSPGRMSLTPRPDKKSRRLADIKSTQNILRTRKPKPIVRNALPQVVHKVIGRSQVGSNKNGLKEHNQDTYRVVYDFGGVKNQTLVMV